MEQWEKNYYISSIAGANNGSSLVVMSKGSFYTIISYAYLMFFFHSRQFDSSNEVFSFPSAVRFFLDEHSEASVEFVFNLIRKSLNARSFSSSSFGHL